MDPVPSFAANINVGHAAILEVLESIHACLHSYREAKPKLLVLQQRLLAHFEKQNNALFDRLSEQFSGDREKLKLIEFLSHDTKDVKVKMLMFYDAHPADMGDLHPGRFVQDFTQLSETLVARMRIEREYLLPLLKAFS